MVSARQARRRDHARELRRKQTAAEVMFWLRVRNRAFHHLKFKRQRPFGPYILDFFCEELNLAVELDGEGHFGDPAQLPYDEERTAFLQSRGLTVLRLENREVLYMPEAAFARLERIARALLAWKGR